MPSGFTRISDIVGNRTAIPQQSAAARNQTFQNQSLPGLSTGTGSAVGQQRSDSVSGGLLQGLQTQKTGVALSSQNTVDSVADSNKRMLGYAQQQGAMRRAKQAAASSAPQRTGAVGGGQANGRPVGQAYTPNGALSNSRNQVLASASSYLGSPYVLGGTTTKGIDCSGLVMMVYNKLGYGITRHSATWQGNNIPGVRTSMNNLRPGDIVAWKDGSHIAIYAGNGEIIESANERVGTVRRKLWAPQSAVFGIALRLPGE